jgi:hypothetical protein
MMPMADCGGSVKREGSGDGPFIHAGEVEMQFASPPRRQDHSMGVVRRRRVRRVRWLRQWPGGSKVGARGARGVGEEGGAAQGGSHGARTGGPRPALSCRPRGERDGGARGLARRRRAASARGR